MKLFITDYISSLPILYAHTKDLFKKEGMNVKIFKHPSYEGILSLVEGKIADIFEIPPLVFLKVAERLNLVAGTTLCNLDYSFYLKGNQVGKEISDSTVVPVFHEFSLERFIMENTLKQIVPDTAGSVEYKQVPFNLLEQIIHSPLTNKLVLDEFVYAVLNSVMDGFQEINLPGSKNLPSSILCFTAEFVRNCPAEALKINNIIKQSISMFLHAEDHPRIIVKIYDSELKPSYPASIPRNLLLKKKERLAGMFKGGPPDWDKLKDYVYEPSDLCVNPKKRELENYKSEITYLIQLEAEENPGQLISNINDLALGILSGNKGIRLAYRNSSVANRVNHMLEYLENSLKFLEYEKDKLENLNSILELKLDRSSVNLQFSEEKYRYLFEYSSEALIIVDSEMGNIVDSNRKFRKTSGYSRTNLTNMRLSDLILNEENIPGGKKSINKIDTMLHIPEVKMVKKDDTIQLMDIDVNSFILSSNKKYQIKFVDSLIRNESEQLKHEFISNISHELKSPMTNIMGYFELLRLDKSLVLNDEVNEIFEVIERNIQKLSDLIENLLKLESNEKEMDENLIETFVAADVITEALEINAKVAKERNLEIIVNLNYEILIEGIRFEFYQIISNLLVNALKYTESGIIHILLNHDGKDNAILIVRDTGIGIDPLYHKAIFERFYRVPDINNRKVGGTGLGLSIIASLLKKIGGNILVNSAKGKGSEFKITIPLPKNLNIKADQN